MKKLLQTTIITLVGIITLVFIGCTIVQDAVTPCYIPPELGEFVNEPMTSFVPYTTVFDAERIMGKMQYFADCLDISLAGAREFQQKVFNPTGPLGLLLVGGPFLYAGGKFIPRGKDRKEIEELKNGKS